MDNISKAFNEMTARKKRYENWAEVCFIILVICGVALWVFIFLGTSIWLMWAVLFVETLFGTASLHLNRLATKAESNFWDCLDRTMGNGSFE